ncbi:hypothetical protein FNH21_03495 [Arthrobacter sp. KR32]|uniref:Uncharacterized protein n=2 Tax=Arthrobacter bussei TaxID=2594179 RepID=A0A7X1TMQ0_9MICC|nr:hypothetical protein [Arthrobacter bussei]
MTLTGLIELVFKEPLDAKKQEQTVLSMVIAMAAEKQKLRAGNRWSGTLSTPSSPRHRRSSRLKNFLAGLNALGEHGPFGDVFCQHTTKEIEIDASVDFDISLIDESQLTLRAAVQTVCWSYGQAGISAAKTLADAGLMEERHHLMIMDELWQSLSASELLVHQIDSITRLNRTEGLGQLMITHFIEDLQLSTDELTKIATGFVERSSVKILGGLAQNESDLLERCSRLGAGEGPAGRLVGWSAGRLVGWSPKGR